jgi:hypothetical protein
MKAAALSLVTLIWTDDWGQRIFWLSHQRTFGRRHRLHDQQPASTVVSGWKLRSASIRSYHHRRGLQLLQPLPAWISGLVLLQSDARSHSYLHDCLQIRLFFQSTGERPRAGSSRLWTAISGPSTNNQIGEVRASHDFSQNWHLMLGVLQQIRVRNLTTAVNALYDSTGDYQTEAENIFHGTISGRFQVKSDLGYLTGNFKTGRITYQAVIGSTGYKFSSWNPKTAVPGSFLCALNDPTVCHANVTNPLIDANPGYTPYTGIYSLYVNSIIHQQGFNFGDTIALTPHWLLRAAASQDWTWTTNYKSPGGPAYETPPGYMSQSVSPTGSMMYKPTANQTAYVTFSDSVQAPDTAPANSTGVIVANANQALPLYRSKEWEAGYKLESTRLNFSADVFRIRRPFADVEETSTTAGYNCAGTPLPAGDICENDQIIGQRINRGAEAMLSGNLTQRLRVIGGITALPSILTDTFVLLPASNPNVSPSYTDPAGVPASALICPSYVTNNKNLVGIPDYKSNILVEYRMPALTGAFFTFNWQYVGRRAATTGTATGCRNTTPSILAAATARRSLAEWRPGFSPSTTFRTFITGRHWAPAVLPVRALRTSHIWVSRGLSRLPRATRSK